MNGQRRLFVACIISLVATSFGFISRAFLLNTLGEEFDLSEEQKGALNGAGLFPFALSIIFFSLIVDRVGYGRCMVFAFLGHAASGVIMLVARDFQTLYLGTLLFALANGTVEAVINPATASLFPKNKTHYLNILHAGWPGGLVLGGLLFMVLGDSVSWQMKMGLYLIPTAVYGIMLLGQKFPEQERVAAGVSYEEMLKEFGWGGCLVVAVFAVMAIDSVRVSLGGGTAIDLQMVVGVAAVPAILFALRFRSFGQPVFVLLLLVMILLATTELGTDGWVAALMEPVFKGRDAGYLVLIYTSAIMFVLRFFAGPIVHRITPLGLLAGCSLLAAGGLVAIANAGASTALVFAAATLYGVGKTFFWPTTLGVVSEQFPRGGAMTLNAIGGMGMISVGVLGAAFLGALQDRGMDRRLVEEAPAVHAAVTGPPVTSYFLEYRPIDKAREAALPPDQKESVAQVRTANSQETLATVAILPGLMFVAYLALILHYRRRGGYRPVDLQGGG